MLSFASDYTEGAHEKILRRLAETNREQFPGYGTDRLCASAKEKIRLACGCPGADVWFFAGGTQTNETVISSMLRSYEGVAAAYTGHISSHEAGAVEFTGHKVLELPAREGKLEAQALENLLRAFRENGNREHMVFPGMAYISHPTEYGTLYTKAELTALHEVCARYGIPLYLDGARLGYGLMSRGTDVTLRDIAELCDVFYIGGTKVGALFGEAVVFPRGNSPEHFFTVIKQHGALLAKGWLLGLQFDTLFTDGLYEELGRNAIEQAETLKAAFREKGYRFFLESPTNQIFLAMENSELSRLKEKVAFGFMEQADESHTVVRFATSWATTPEQVKALISLL